MSKDLSANFTKHVREIGESQSKIVKIGKFKVWLKKNQGSLYIRVIFPCISSNESAILVVASEVVVSATVVCSRVVGIIVASGVVVFSEDKVLIKSYIKDMVLLNIFEEIFPVTIW